MKFSKYFSFVLLGIAAATGAQAQSGGPVTLRLNYSVNVPMGDFKNNISRTSFNGVNADILYHVNPALSVGLATGFHDFYQKYPRDVYKTTDGDVSAVLSYSIQTIPIMAKAQYNFATDGSIQPYVGLGVGGNVITWRQYLGEFGSSNNKFGFAAAPEAGVFFPFRKNGATGLNVSANYNYMPFSYSGFKNLNSLGVNAGITFPLK